MELPLCETCGADAVPGYELCENCGGGPAYSPVMRLAIQLVAHYKQPHSVYRVIGRIDAIKALREQGVEHGGEPSHDGGRFMSLIDAKRYIDEAWDCV